MSETDLKVTDNIFDDIFDLIASGENNKSIARVINAKYDKNYNATSSLIKKTREKFVANYETPDREHYFKESLIDYDKIKDEADDIRDRKEALKLKLSVLRDRNELLGLSKAAVNIEINFEGKNYKDNDFLKDHDGEVIDVEAKDGKAS